MLAVSQFTLYADTRGRNRPSFTDSARPEEGEAVHDRFGRAARAGRAGRDRRFGPHMQVELVNDGPVTILLES